MCGRAQVFFWVRRVLCNRVHSYVALAVSDLLSTELCAGWCVSVSPPLIAGCYWQVCPHSCRTNQKEHKEEQTFQSTCLIVLLQCEVIKCIFFFCILTLSFAVFYLSQFPGSCSVLMFQCSASLHLVIFGKTFSGLPP